MLTACALALASCAGVQQPAEARVAAATQPSVELISANDLAVMLERGEVVLIDVRTPYEFADGRNAGALNAPLTHFHPASIPLEAGRETILYCRTAGRSAIAAQMLTEHTGGRVRHMAGGITAWREAGLPEIANKPEDDPRANQ